MMNYFSKTKEELLNELKDLQQMYSSSKKIYNSESIPDNYSVIAKANKENNFESVTNYKENYYG
jgi:hypothetical protein